MISSLCNRLITSSTLTWIKQSFHTSSMLGIRRRNTNPGIDNRISILSEDDPFIKELQDEEELDQQLDVMNADVTYDDHVEELRSAKEKKHRAMTMHKYFKPPKQPPMLTYAEREQIRYLHNKDPVEWSVDALSKSFPATPVIIKSVLKSKFKPENADSIKRMDRNVHENWNLLKEDKLEADLRFLQHLKKFSNKRGEMLSDVECYEKVLQKKEEPRWNNGQMIKIIEGYEKSINNLMRITDGKDQQPKLQTASGFVKDRIDLEVQLNQKHTERGHFLIGNNTPDEKDVTLEKLEKRIKQKINKGKKVSPFEKVFAESTVEDKIKDHGFKTSEMKTDNFRKGQNNKSYINFKREENIESRVEEKIKDHGFKSREMKTDNFRKDQTNKSFINFKREVNIEEFLQNESPNHEESSRKTSTKDIDSSITKAEYEYKNEKDRIYFENEEADISHSSFWDNVPDTNQSVMIPKDDMKVDKYIRNPPVQINSNLDRYPERIRVPKNKLGTGVTFKVNDCYYDDDGEFLYRVPGMKA